jgi:hypothetical protein
MLAIDVFQSYSSIVTPNEAKDECSSNNILSNCKN